MNQRMLKVSLFIMSLFLMSPAFAIMRPDVSDVAQSIDADQVEGYQEAATVSEDEDGRLQITIADQDKERWERMIRKLEIQAQEEERNGKVIQVKSGAKPKSQMACTQFQGGSASYYADSLEGNRVSKQADKGKPQERYSPNLRTAAHRTLPFDTMVRVTNLNNGKTTMVRINDRGPFIKGRTIDLSKIAAKDIDLIKSGHAKVKIEICKG